jgi:hypothetical protein
MSCEYKQTKQHKRSGSCAGNRYKCDCCEILSISCRMEKTVCGYAKASECWEYKGWCSVFGTMDDQLRSICMPSGVGVT